jgi:hypothetical protein
VKWWWISRCCCDDGDDSQSTKDLRSFENRCLSACSPSRSLPEVRFLRVLISLDLNLWSVFTGRTIWWGEAIDKSYMRRYGWVLPVSKLVQLFGSSLLEALPPRCVNNYFGGFCSIWFVYLSTENGMLTFFPNEPSESGILLQAQKAQKHKVKYAANWTHHSTLMSLWVTAMPK